ncbi:MAG: M6 family metalloprotease domain-containing protein [Candidatus Zixiibacteriota bacterium]
MYKPSIIALFLILNLMLAVTLSAMPFTEEVYERLKAEGQLEKFIEMTKALRAQGIENPLRDTSGGLKDAAVIWPDTFRIVVILIDFPDLPYTDGYAAATPADFDSLLLSDGKVPTGSMKEFYLENSYGDFTLFGEVYGWYRAANSHGYYTDYCTGGGGGIYPNSPERLVEEAIELADADIDFSLYDNDNDGRVDGLFVVHAGVPYEDGQDACAIWSHAGGIWDVEKDDVIINGYSIEGEESGMVEGMVQIGVFCHEFGHMLWLPDLYDYDYSSRGCGDWTLMAFGSWNNDGRTPAHLDAWCKAELGFISVDTLQDNLTYAALPAAEYNPTAYRLWANGMVGPEYFIVENRQKYGFDAALPGEGLLIWHVNDTLWGNGDEWLPHIMLEQADGSFHLQENTNQGDAGDPYPGALVVREFGDKSNPDSRAINGAITQVAVWDISDSDSLMTANLDVRWSRPYFTLDSVKFVDENGDGFFDSGESVEAYIFLRNEQKTATGVTANISCANMDVIFGTSEIYMDIVPGDNASSNNLGTPFTYTVPELVNPAYDSFFIEINAPSYSYTANFELEQELGHTRILIIDDDRGGDYDELYLGDFRKKRAPAHIWEKASLGSPPGTELSKYSMVVWFTGDSALDFLQTEDINAMKYYMDNGGNLFLTGQGLAGELNSEDPDFLANYLRTQYDGLNFYFEHTGIAGSLIGDGLKVRYYSGSGQAIYLSQKITPINGGQAEFRFKNNTTAYSALSYSGDYKLVFFNWGYEALWTESVSYARRDTILTRIMLFLDGWNEPPCFDGDSDGFGDPDHAENICADDNCPDAYNPDQADSDGDGIGDACDTGFLCGDVNVSGGVNILDVTYIISYLYKGGPEPVPMASADVNNSGSVNILDVTYLISYLYKGGPAPTCP